jgi:hypothetical protein
MSSNQFNYILAITGFVLANLFLLFFAGKYEGDKSENSIFINISSFSIHLHHWMIGLIGLILCLIIEQFIGRNHLVSIFKGLALGLIFHDLTFYLNYFKIFN